MISVENPLLIKIKVTFWNKVPYVILDQGFLTFLDRKPLKKL